jgi:hypothetical protein
MASSKHKFYKSHPKTEKLMEKIQRIKNKTEREIYEILAQQLAYKIDEEFVKDFNDSEWCSF